MRTINAITDLKIPEKYQMHITEYLDNIATIPFISRVVLFGSCAKEAVTPHSDIDIFITANREISLDEELHVTCYCLPAYSEDGISTDVLIQSENVFNEYVNTVGMVQKQVNHFGVDLSGLIRKRTGN